MALTSLRIANFRNLASVELSLTPGQLNIISGKNGSGKTSILEAIYYLGHGRSFRTATSSRLIQHEADKFSVFSQIVNDSRDIPIGLERDLRGATRLRIAEKDVASITELASYLPIRIINSQSHNIFESGPIHRRKYLDWGLFYQAENFLSCWRHFERALKQRNALLRDRRSRSEVEVWTNELTRYGLEFDKLRRAYVEALAPIISTMAHQLLSIPEVEICYLPGWDDSREYADILADQFYEESRSGHTQYGPHRADLDIKFNGVSARHYLSRGQQKLLICAMILAQGRLFANETNKGVIYLVDDLPAELDLEGRTKLLTLISSQKMQTFITAIESETISAFISDNPNVLMKVFHVEHGSVEAQQASCTNAINE